MKRSRTRWFFALLIAATSAVAQRSPDWVQVRKEVPASVKLPEAQYTPVLAWEAEDAGSNVGRIVNDPEAYNHKAREARTSEREGQGDKEGHILYGPYIDLPSGTYAAFFRVKLLDDTRDGETVAEIDACVGYGQNILASREWWTPSCYRANMCKFRSSSATTVVSWNAVCAGQATLPCVWTG